MTRIRSLGPLALALLASAPVHAQQPAGQRLDLPVLPHVTITVLADNVSGGGPVLGEWGLSFYVQSDRARVLFDAGQGQVMLPNARALDVDLARTSAIVVSHGHWDHTRGLEQALRATGPVDLYLHPAVFETRYWKDEGRAVSTTMALGREQLGGRVHRLVETTGPTLVAPGIMVTGQIPRASGEGTGVDFVFMDSALTRPDSIPDDQALFFRVREGIVIVLGCGHAGVINTMQYVTRLLGEQKVYAVIGGTHLMSASPERMRRTIEALRAFGVQKIMLSHCTGLKAYAQLAAAFPGQVSWPNSGSTIELGGPSRVAAAPAPAAPTPSLGDRTHAERN